MSENQQYRLGVDVGGTFTDFVLLDENNSEIHIAKSLTTPADPSVGILTGVKAFDERCEGHVEATRRIAHATTLVANSVIERKGAVTALLTTKGFRDILELLQAGFSAELTAFSIIHIINDVLVILLLI